VIPPLRRPLFLAPPFAPPRALTRAQRARAAAAIFALAAADIRRLPPLREPTVAPPPPAPPTNPLNRLSNASIWRRIDKACSKFRVDKSIDVFDRVNFFLMQEIVKSSLSAELNWFHYHCVIVSLLRNTNAEALIV